MRLFLRLIVLAGVTAIGAGALSGCGPELGISAILHGCPPNSLFCNLYVANYSGNDITSYQDPGRDLLAYSTPDTAPVGIAADIDANSKYVVTDQVTGSVTAFAWPIDGVSTPVATFGTSARGFMAFDSKGNLWAASQNAVVVEYVPPFTNSTTESNGLTNGITDSYGIAFDSSGNMYVSNADSSGTVVMYAPPYSALTKTITVPDANPGLHGLAASSSQLFVADTRNDKILVYNLPLSGNTPDVQITTTAPLGLAVDPKGRLLVSEQGHNRIDVFGPPFSNSSAPAGSITGGLNGPFGVTISS